MSQVLTTSSYFGGGPKIGVESKCTSSLASVNITSSSNKLYSGGS